MGGRPLAAFAHQSGVIDHPSAAASMGHCQRVTIGDMDRRSDRTLVPGSSSMLIARRISPSASVGSGPKPVVVPQKESRGTSHAEVADAALGPAPGVGEG